MGLDDFDDDFEEEHSTNETQLERLLSKIIHHPEPTSPPSYGSSPRRALRKASLSISALLSKSASSNTDVQPLQGHTSDSQLQRAVTFVLEGTRVRMLSPGEGGDSGCEILGLQETAKRPTPHVVRTLCCPSLTRPAPATLAHSPRLPRVTSAFRRRAAGII